MEMDSEDRRRSAEILKDLIVERKRSRWPQILGVLVLLSIAGAAGYWFYLPPDQRPALDGLAGRLKSMAQSLVNTPIAAPPAASNAPAVQKSTATPSDTGLLST